MYTVLAVRVEGAPPVSPIPSSQISIRYGNEHYLVEKYEQYTFSSTIMKLSKIMDENLFCPCTYDHLSFMDTYLLHTLIQLRFSHTSSPTASYSPPYTHTLTHPHTHAHTHTYTHTHTHTHTHTYAHTHTHTHTYAHTQTHSH